MLLNWIFHSFVRTSCYRFDTCSATYLTADLTTTDTAGFLATVDVTTDLATTHLVADLAADKLATRTFIPTPTITWTSTSSPTSLPT